jgi:hypothetical protein
MYVQGGGKRGAHAWTEEIDSIGLASYLAVKVYDQEHRETFNAIHSKGSITRTSTFRLVSGNAVLRKLVRPLHLEEDRKSLRIDMHDLAFFSTLNSAIMRMKLASALKLLTKARRADKTVLSV